MSYRIKRRDLRPYILNWLVNELGTTCGDVFYMAVAGSAMETMLLENGVPDDRIFHTLATAEDATTTDQNDVVLVTPGLYTETETTITWDKNNVHVIGMGPKRLQHHPHYVKQGGTATDTWITVSGHYNTFTNFRFEHGTDSATNAHCIDITGYGNVFKNIHYDSPYNPIGQTYSELAVSGFDIVKIGTASNTLGGSWTQFDNCVIGNSYALMTDVCANVGFTGNAWWQAIFNNCIFVKRCGNVTNLYLHTYQTPNTGNWAQFNNCSFVNTGTAVPQFGVDGYAMDVKYSQFVFNNCTMSRCTDVVADTYESNLWFNAPVFAAAATQNGLAGNPDVA